MLTKEEAAAAMTGCQYRREGTHELFAELKASGLVAVFGASDDLIEFRGAIDDEDGAWEGGEYPISPTTGLLRNKCDHDDCPYFEKVVEGAAKIKAIWAHGDYSWTYETIIPHSKFIVLEGDDPYCEGIVFALAEVPVPNA